MTDAVEEFQQYAEADWYAATDLAQVVCRRD
jgi:hypothetical protein